jgi:hypothetical protein
MVAEILHRVPQNQQSPSTPPIHDTPTRVPTGISAVAPSTTSPTIWCPGISRFLNRGRSPSTICKIRAADTARQHAQQQMSRLHDWRRHLLHAKKLSWRTNGSIEHGSFHDRKDSWEKRAPR